MGRGVGDSPGEQRGDGDHCRWIFYYFMMVGFLLYLYTYKITAPRAIELQRRASAKVVMSTTKQVF